MGVAHFRDDRRRVKGKIIDKLKKFQFPNNKDIKGYIIYLEDFLSDFDDVEDSILGTPTVIFSEDKSLKEIRKQDGIVHREDVKRTIFQEIDFVITFKRPNLLQKTIPFKIMINKDRAKITDEELKTIFSLEK